MNTFWQNFIDWLITSSANPDEYSATIQGILVLNAALIIKWAAFIGVPLSQTVVVNDIGIACQVLGGFLGIFGIIRKVWYTLFPKVQPPPAVGSVSTGAPFGGNPTNTAMGSVSGGNATSSAMGSVQG